MSDVIVSAEAVEEVRPAESPTDVLDEQLIGQLVDRARASALQLTGEGGLLQQLTKGVLESALEGEITDHLGYEKHDPAGAGSGNSRNGVRSKTVLTDVGPVQIEVPRDREGSFEPQIVKKRQRRLTGSRPGARLFTAPPRRFAAGPETWTPRRGCTGCLDPGMPREQDAAQCLPVRGPEAGPLPTSDPVRAATAQSTTTVHPRRSTAPAGASPQPNQRTTAPTAT